MLERPQSRSADFYRELGEIFSVQLKPHNRWGGFKAFRERWKDHVVSTRIKPVLLVDEAQEMATDVLSELQILASADFDATSLLTIILSGDGRLVHHTRKNAAGGVAAGQGLRGSSDIHAFGDSNLYLRRTSGYLVLSSEHRAAAASPPVYLELVAADEETTHLRVVGQPEEEQRHELARRVLDLLDRSGELTRAKLRDQLSVKNERLGQALEQAGQIRRTPAGWQRVERA
jgi:hypothetical protein